ncbi:MAG: glycosyltransferase family 39 protein [Prevotella sp.]|jgi:hypothetical protein|nr:glycosyltransferase family 39 protein [Prevotella sp.]
MKITNTLQNYLLPLFLLLFAVVFVFFNSKNSPLYLFNEWGDANIYFSMGKGIMNGLVPYRDLFDHKGPLVFLLYGLAYLIDGDGFTGVYLFECIFLFINIFFACKIARLYLSKPLSAVISLVYAVLLFNKSYYGGSAEEFISVFITVSFYYFILYCQNSEKNKQYLLIQGAMFTLAFLAKLSVCVFWLPLIFIVLYDLAAERKNILKPILYLCAGCTIVLLPFAVYFAANSALNDFYWGYIQFNSIYAEFQTPADIILKAIFHAGWMLKHDPLSFPLTLLGTGVLLFGKKHIPQCRHRVAVFLSFLLSFLFVSMSKYVMTYAHIVLYIYAIFGVIWLCQLFSSLRGDTTKQSIAIYALSFIICLSTGIYNKKLFGQDTACLLRQKECNYMQQEFADIIKEAPYPTLLDLGLDHGIYTKAGIVPSYKYFFYPNIPYRLFPDIRDAQEKLIAERKPMFIVAGNTSMNYGYFKELPALNNNYELIATFRQNIEAFDAEVYLWRRKSR